MAPVADDWKRISDIVSARAAELRLSMSAVRRRAGEPGPPMDHKTVAKMADGEPLGTDRSRHRLARALDWPGNAIALLLDGAEPGQLPTVPFGGPDDPDGPALVADVAQLLQDRDEDRLVISYLVRQLDEVRRTAGAPLIAVDEETEILIAAYTGNASAVDFSDPGSTTRRRNSTFDQEGEAP